jgi:SAM-dependent methyltransferase
MKTIVSIQEISEFDIKPREAVDEWRRLVDEEISTRWRNRSDWPEIAWPTCGRNGSVPAFDRYGFSYVECDACGSLYAPRRPSEDALWSWYREAKPSLFWRERILPESETARLEKILRPRADWILDGIAEYHASARRAIDLSPHSRPMLDLLVSPDARLEEIVAAGATADFEGSSGARVKVRPTPISRLAELDQTDVIIAMDVFNRAPDPQNLLDNFASKLSPGGLIFGTATVASGFEVQTLWERSPTVIPPDKLNLPTVTALQEMFAEPAWEILELSTPGMFDVEVVRQEIARNDEGSWPRTVRALVERTNPSGRLALVELLQSLRLTSFARFVFRKRY